MNIESTPFENLFVLVYKSFKDNRGEFVKTINKKTFAENAIEWEFTESFYSISGKNVFRGMHFQYRPHDHDKLVYVVKGSILDIVLDLRSDSKTFGKYFTIELSEENRKGLHIGRGFAHGFLSLEEGTIVEYHTTTEQNKESEGGIKWDSFGAQVEIKNPIISVRDSQFENFDPNQKYFK
jgi:dTDP-4-dehydrorhamnose 3,5-epimerase/CDP-3, 6-dideoxy-D-glycero-D-glycero-4-hexulose-5-epimerase